MYVMAKEVKEIKEGGGRRKRIGTTQKKVLVLLLGGLALGLTRSPRQYFRIVREMKKEWRNINRRSLENSIRLLYASQLVETKSGPNNTLTLVLSREGERRALSYDLEHIRIDRPKQWDKKWRIVIFDIPERKKIVRESVRMHLRQMGFIELQHSVWVLPFDCQKEIEYVSEFYFARKFIRFIVAESIDNELHLKQRFNL